MFFPFSTPEIFRKKNGYSCQFQLFTTPNALMWSIKYLQYDVKKKFLKKGTLETGRLSHSVTKVQ